MKSWIEKEKTLLELQKGIQAYGEPMASSSQKSNQRPKKPANTGLTPEDAANKIKHFWRGYKIKEAVVADAYGSYLSMIAPDDEQRLLSSIMFGRHEAEIQEDAQDRIHNPNIHPSALYHRGDPLSGALMEQLQKEFQITSKMLKGKVMIPVTELKTVPIDEFIKQSGVRDIQVIRDDKHSISILLVPIYNRSVRTYLVSSGLVASPWEIAQNIALPSEKKLSAAQGMPATRKTINRQHLPRTKEALLRGDLFIKLKKIANNKKYPTHQLASSIIQLLEKSDVLTPDATQRIALMIDMSNTFYANNYSRYAFCVYAIIHELSLSMALQTDPDKLDHAFKDFLGDTKETLKKSLTLTDKNLAQTTFIASPALSGTNAFMIAKRIAQAMHVKSGKTPTIQTCDPYYYELHTTEFANPWLADPDIFLFSTGPIVNLGGLTPGVDINRFVKEEIIKRGRTKPTTLIVDVTSGLYRNLKLEPEVKQLIQDGKLSIVIFESHQKFGLLHSDQAQCGRVFGVCSTKNHDMKQLQKIQEDAQLDFNQHLDMRIGANINHCCKDALEKIKEQHFSNGALFKTILGQAKLISKHIVTHKYMTKNFDELYFVIPRASAQFLNGIVSFRSSFGHYATTRSYIGVLNRLCANASDETDALIISARIYLALTYRGKEKNILKHTRATHALSQAQQVIYVAMTQNMINATLHKQPTSLTEQIELYGALRRILKACPSLKGRESYLELTQCFYRLQTAILAEADTSEANPQFLKALNIAYDNHITVSQDLLTAFKLSAPLCQFIVFMERSLPCLPVSATLISDLIAHPRCLDRLIKHQSLLVEQADFFNRMKACNIPWDAEILEALLAEKQTFGFLNQCLDEGLVLNAGILRMMSNKKTVSFLLSQESVSMQTLATVSMLHESGLEMDTSTMMLAKDNPTFCELIALVYETNASVLSHLKEKEGGQKYNASLKHTPMYLKECFDAIRAHCTDVSSTKASFIKSIASANKKYCDVVLSQHRNLAVRFMSDIFKSFIECIEAMTPPLPFIAVPQKITYTPGFFETTSAKKIHAMETKLNESASLEQQGLPPKKNK